jgi:hypothetical protein
MSANGKESWGRRAWRVVKASLRLGSRSGLATVRELLVVMVPVIVIMTAIEAMGFLPKIAGLFAPAMRFLRLPGDAALVFISGVFVNLYSAVAVAANIALTVKQITVLALLGLICHNLPVECAVQKKAGTGVWATLAVRLLTGFLGAYAASRLIPETGRWIHRATEAGAAQTLTRRELLWLRATGNAVFLAKVVVIIMALMILMEFLRQTGVLRWLMILLRPVTWLSGLSSEAGFPVMTAAAIGLAFGAGTVIAEARRGELSPQEQFRANVFMGTTHSLFEDTMLFVILHASVLWLVVGRLAIGCLAVRLFSLTRWLYLKTFGDGG